MYSAIVTKVLTRPHPNADKLQLATVTGMQVIVGLDVKDKELGVFFPSDGQLSNQFCELNDLYPRFDDQGNQLFMFTALPTQTKMGLCMRWAGMM